MVWFGNEAKKKSRQLSVGDRLLWSFGVRVRSDEAAVVVVTAIDEAGWPAEDAATRLFESAWQGATHEAAQYYTADVVREVMNDDQLRSQGVELLRECQANMGLVEIFDDNLLDVVRARLGISS